MKVTCKQEQFHQGLTLVNRAAPTRSNIPAYMNVLLSAGADNRIKMVANNDEMSITTWISSVTTEPGEISVPARLLNEFINYLPKETITIHTMTDDEQESPDPHNRMDNDRRLSIECAKAKTKINGIPASDFRMPLRPEKPTTVSINSQEFMAAIEAVAFCAATDKTRPILNGVQILIDGDQFTMAATDGFRLARQKGGLDQHVKTPMEIVVPTTTLTELAHIRADSAEPIRMSVSKDLRQVMFETKTAPPGEYQVELTSKIIEGAFPNFTSMIPSTYEVRAVFDTKQLMMCTKTAAIFSKDGNNAVVCRIQPNKDYTPPASNDPDDQPNKHLEAPGIISIAGRSEVMGDNVTVLDAIEMEGEELTIGFNSKFLMDALTSLNSNKVSTVILEMQTHTSPGVIKTNESHDYLHLIMPIFLND